MVIEAAMPTDPVAPDAVEQLKQAIDANDDERVRVLMTANPALHRAPMGYGHDGPLTWVAECRVPWEPPGKARLAMARWMIENGSDVHQGGDGPLMRAALNGDRIPMMELLVAHGADVTPVGHGHYPIIHASCESLNPEALLWLLQHGADPNPRPGRALDYAIETYARSLPRLSACIDALLHAGGLTRYREPWLLALLRGRINDLARELFTAPELAHLRFPELDCGVTAGRRLTLRGATLLHVAAEYGSLEAAGLLIGHGGDVNAPAAIHEAGVGGQTPIFHAVTQFGDYGLPVTRLLLDRGADLSLRDRATDGLR